MFKASSSTSIAIIDIGSNSIRLMVYDALKRMPLPLYNEKILCGLARNLTVGGNLDKDSVGLALHAVGRFITLSRIMKVGELCIFATAAVRDASDGKAFVASLQHTYDVEVEILTGEEEARFAGLGVLSGIPDAEGVVGDLGGGSLELISVAEGISKKGASFPIGALRLIAEGSGQVPVYDKIISKALDAFSLKEKLQGKTFYAVGGAFRNLAKIHITRKGYGLRVLHHYTIEREEFLETLRLVSKMSGKALQRLGDIPKKRLDILPAASRVAYYIMKQGNPKDIVFSVHGVREGVLFSKLSSEDKKQDPLLAGCYDMVSKVADNSLYSQELERWMRFFFTKEDSHLRRLRMAICLLSEISRYENTEYRAELAYKRVLDSALGGINHKDRVFMATALFYRYAKGPADTLDDPLQQLLTAEAFTQAQIIGTTIRLARCLTGCGTGFLEKIPLKMTPSELILSLQKENTILVGETLEKRLSNLATVVRRVPVIKVQRG